MSIKVSPSSNHTLTSERYNLFFDSAQKEEKTPSNKRRRHETPSQPRPVHTRIIALPTQRDLETAVREERQSITEFVQAKIHEYGEMYALLFQSDQSIGKNLTQRIQGDIRATQAFAKEHQLTLDDHVKLTLKVAIENLQALLNHPEYRGNGTREQSEMSQVRKRSVYPG